MMTIGQFAHLSGLTPKALRFYDEKGLLRPDGVDDVTAYRRYGPSQLRRAATIKVLRQMGMSLSQVGEVLDSPDRCADLLARYRDEVAAQRAAQDEAIQRGPAILASYDEPVAIESRAEDECHWVGAVMEVDLSSVEVDRDAEQYNAAFGRLAQALQDAGNPPVGAFWTTVRADSDGRGGQLLLCWPVATAVDSAFTVEDVRLEHGTLAKRTEAFARLHFDEAQFPKGPPGDGAPHPGLIALLEHLDHTGSKAADDFEVRQVGVLDDDGMPVGMDLTISVSPSRPASR